jgi:hypothetical protein
VNIYSSEADATNKFNTTQKYYLPYRCPYSFVDEMCGSWCPLFEYADISDTFAKQRVFLGCGSGRKNFQVTLA